jgi:hypothetical protein
MGHVGVGLNKGSAAVTASVTLGTKAGIVIPFEVLGLPTMFTGGCRYGGPFLGPFTEMSVST